MITTRYALGYYFKKASDASYLIQMNLGPLNQLAATLGVHVKWPPDGGWLLNRGSS